MTNQFIMIGAERVEDERRQATMDMSFASERVKKLAQESKQYFRNSLGEFVYYRTYARWLEHEKRRETWIETIDRYMSFMKKNLGDVLVHAEYQEIRDAILKQEVMPSMRLLQFSGKAADATNVCAYNCSYVAPSALEDFAEIMYVLMCGAGVGFSVERKFVELLPPVKVQKHQKPFKHTIADSREGWCDALTIGLTAWFNGEDVEFDFSHLRPAGARLRTMGGKSSGPEPLKNLISFAKEKLLRKQGRSLSTLDVHDIVCKIGEVVVAGGVRRSALISLSDLHDEELRDAKQGAFYLNEPQRSLANNSAVYNEKPSSQEFLQEWLSLMKSGTGERGIFNRGGLKKTLPERRKLLCAEQDFDTFGVNPCGEIILRPKQFCNLTEIIARAEDDEQSLLRKVRIAAILGTYQSTLTLFPYLSDTWRKNCEEERLLGVSITGQWDCTAVRNPEIMRKLKKQALEINEVYAKRFGINPSTSITCVKPSGTASKTFDTASGIHPRFAPYYIQRIRISSTDSLFKMLRDQGVPYHPEVGQSAENATTFVLEFPIKSPEGAIFKDQISAIDQLEYWKMVKENYTEHNPSVTIYISEDEWIESANWLYKNWDIIGGLSFLPRTNHVYLLAPYEEIDKKRYEELAKKVAHVDFSKILDYELQDETTQSLELACVAGNCELS